MGGRKEIDILLVEDDPGDVELTREGFKGSKILINVHAVDDGIKALKYLRREEPYAYASMPDLILLDLNLPRKDGRETLREIKTDEKLKGIPVVVLTTSEAEPDIAQCYRMGANCYIAKPVGFEAYTRAIRAIEDFWFSVVKMPPKK